jgi:hypothetical protein
VLKNVVARRELVLKFKNALLRKARPTRGCGPGDQYVLRSSECKSLRFAEDVNRSKEYFLLQV